MQYKSIENVFIISVWKLTKSVNDLKNTKKQLVYIIYQM